jgi:hypothetical protein
VFRGEDLCAYGGICARTAAGTASPLCCTRGSTARPGVVCFGMSDPSHWGVLRGIVPRRHDWQAPACKSELAVTRERDREEP